MHYTVKRDKGYMGDFLRFENDCSIEPFQVSEAVLITRWAECYNDSRMDPTDGRDDRNELPSNSPRRRGLIQTKATCNG